MAESNPELERVRESLLAEAAGRSIPEIQERVQEAVDALHATARGIPPEQFDVPSGGDARSPGACLARAIGYNLAVARQVLYVALAGELPPYEETELPADRDGLLARHSEGMESLYAHMQEALPDAFLDIRWQHPAFGELNWREWFLFLGVHTLDQREQLEAMLAPAQGGEGPAVGREG